MECHAWMEAVKAAAREMPRYVQELCLLDTSIGDGDHGVTIGRGYQNVELDVPVSAETTTEEFCKRLGGALAAHMGGAIGPVYGVMWKAMARALSGKTEIDAPALADALNAAAAKISSICQVKEGEKTMFDALVSAARALDAHRSDDLPQAMAAAAAGAEAGCEATRGMLAKKGRARFCGEKSIGHIDAGACSFAKWMRALEKAVNERM